MKDVAKIITRKPLERHRRRCSVCRHPHREEIEQDYLYWRNPERLAKDYAIADYSSIYRHL